MKLERTMSKSAILMGENLTYVKMNKMYFKKKNYR